MDRVKKKRIDNKKSYSKQEEFCENKNANSSNGKLDSETDITENTDCPLKVDNIDIDTLVDECLLEQVIETKVEGEIADSSQLLSCPSFHFLILGGL